MVILIDSIHNVILHMLYMINNMTYLLGQSQNLKIAWAYIILTIHIIVGHKRFILGFQKKNDVFICSQTKLPIINIIICKLLKY